jgi:DNA invertase Pin-like site-specific DNA recombinase
LTAALEYVGESDSFVVTKLDRLARSVANRVEIVGALERKGVALKILDLGMDTSTPTGRLMLTVIGGIAQFEREIMIERQREGIAAAKAEGKYRGRAPTARRKAVEIRKLRPKASARPRLRDALALASDPSTECCRRRFERR